MRLTIATAMVAVALWLELRRVRAERDEALAHVPERFPPRTIM
jgi:hypothetical protein